MYLFYFYKMRFKTNLKFFILLFFCINFQFSAQIDSVDIYLKSNQSNDKILTNVDRYLINNLDNYNYLISSGEKLLKFSEIVKSDSAKLLGYYYIGYGLDGNQNFEPAVKNYFGG